MKSRKILLRKPKTQFKRSLPIKYIYIYKENYKIRFLKGTTTESLDLAYASG